MAEEGNIFRTTYIFHLLDWDDKAPKQSLKQFAHRLFGLFMHGFNDHHHSLKSKICKVAWSTKYCSGLTSYTSSWWKWGTSNSLRHLEAKNESKNRARGNRKTTKRPKMMSKINFRNLKLKSYEEYLICRTFFVE